MEQQKPQIPSLKDSQKPQVKIKGLQAGLSLIDRLKQFKKKDLMFISAGLGVLFMAPLAEHLLMSPEQGRSGSLSEGWSFPGDKGLGFNASPYEAGINGLAPGGVTGGGDIITPLNVRDPSALVMGPGAQQQAPATNTTPAPPPPSTEKAPDWKDAIANAAAEGASKATKKASLPVPKPSLTNAGLRGLGAVSGGGGGSFSPGAISSQGLASNKAAGRDFNRVQAAPGYRGAANARGPQSGSSGSFENLKKAAGGMTDTLNRSGPASSALETAANSNMGGGAGSGIGAGGHGPDEKGPSGSQNKDSMNVGESLEFMRQKMEQEKALDLKWKLKEADAMLWPELRKDMLKTLVTKPLEGLAGDMGKAFSSWGGDKSQGKSRTVIKCGDGSEWNPDNYSIEGSGALCKKTDKGCETVGPPQIRGCQKITIHGEDGKKGDPNVEGNVPSAVNGSLGDGNEAGALDLDSVCKYLATVPEENSVGRTLLGHAKAATEVRMTLYKAEGGNDCLTSANNVTVRGDAKTVAGHQNAVKKQLGDGRNDNSFANYIRDAAMGVGDAAIDVNKRLKELEGKKYLDEAAYKGEGASEDIKKEIQAAADAQKALKEGSEKTDKAIDEGDDAPLTAAKKHHELAGEALKKLEGKLPKAGAFEDAAFLDAIKKQDEQVDLGKSGKKPGEVAASVKAIVETQAKYLEAAVKAQAELKKKLDEADKLRPTSKNVVAQLSGFLTAEQASETSIPAAGEPVSKDPLKDGSSVKQSVAVFKAGQVGETKLPARADLDLPPTEENKPKIEAAKSALKTARESADKEIKKLKATASYMEKQVDLEVREGANKFMTAVQKVDLNYGK